MRRLPWLVVLAVLFSVRTARAYDVDDDNFTPEVLRCEEAVGKVLECCPGFVADNLRCTYRKEESISGCDFKTTITITPAYDDDESRCILGATCAVLRDSGVCGRAQAATTYVDVSRSSIDSPPAWREDSSHAPVCP